MEAILRSLLPNDEWDVSAYGDSFICPCGTEIEQDGECYNGHISPMITMGMI